MLREKINKVIEEYGIKRQAIIQTIGSNRPSFQKKMKDNSFTEQEKNLFMAKYGAFVK